MKKSLLLSACLLAAVAGLAIAQTRPAIDRARLDAVIKDAFPRNPADWTGRLAPDATMQACNASRNAPAASVAIEIAKRERASIVYPADGKLLGDWKSGERIAQSGYGMRFTDYPAAQPNGGNCYACHELTKQEVSFGTIGPSLREYGKIRKFAEADTRAAYDKIYNSHASFPCSLMPRFGSNGVLTVEQVRDLTALLMSPDSPVNQ